jgi:hypothetical protein
MHDATIEIDESKMEIMDVELINLAWKQLKILKI